MRHGHLGYIVNCRLTYARRQIERDKLYSSHVHNHKLQTSFLQPIETRSPFGQYTQKLSESKGCCTHNHSSVLKSKDKI